MPVPARKVAAPASSGVDFGSLASPIYTGGFVLPEGRYALFFDVILQQPREGSTFNKVRLGVDISAVPLDKPDAEPFKQFLSMGSKAHESFAPSEDGKGLTPIVGGPGNLTTKSNWNLFRDSMYNAGLPVGVFTDSLTTLDGIWVQTGLMAEPEERKGYAASNTGEAQQEQRSGNNKIPVVVEILDGGKPWEGTGGMPDAPAAPAKKAAAPKAAPAAVRTAPKAAPAAAPAGDAGDEEAVKMAAVNAIGGVLSDAKYAATCPRLILKTGVFKAVTETDGKEMAQAVTNAFFTDDDSLTALLGEIGYTLVGNAVKPQA